MANLNLTIADDVYSELTDVAEQLKISPEQCAQLALHHFLQTDTIENSIEGIARMDDGEELVDFPELKEELGIEIKFHPAAMDELESVTEEDQIEILEQLVTRISAQEEDLEATLDIVIKEEGENQIVLSGFDFGDIVYQLGQNIIIYHIALIEEEDEDDEDDELDDDFEEDEEAALDESEEHKTN